MKEIIQTYDGELQNIDELENVNDVIQPVQMADGTLKPLEELKIRDKIVSLKNGKTNSDTVLDINCIDFKKYIYIVLKNGYRLIIPESFELLTTKNTALFSQIVAEFKEGDYISLPVIYKTFSRNIKFDPWDFNDRMYIVGIKKWYLDKLNYIMNKNHYFLKDISNMLNVPYHQIRRNPSKNDSINIGQIKRFIVNFYPKNMLYDALEHGKGLKGEKSASRIAKIPYEYTEDLAYLDAVVVGDGHITHDKKQLILEFTDSDYNKKVKNILKKVHNYHTNSHRIDLPGCLAIFYSEMLGIVNGKKSKIVEFPQNALKDKNVLIGAIRGIIDTEGSIFIDEKNHVVGVTTSSFRLLLGFISALLHFGIVCSIRKSKKDSTWNISITRLETKKLLNVIEYLEHPEKNKRLSQIKKKRYKNTKIIPNVGRIVKESRQSLNLSTCRLAQMIGLTNIKSQEVKGVFSFNSLSRINEIIKNKKISYLLSRDLHWNKIIYKKELVLNSQFYVPKTRDFFFMNHIPVRCK